MIRQPSKIFWNFIIRICWLYLALIFIIYCCYFKDFEIKGHKDVTKKIIFFIQVTHGLYYRSCGFLIDIVGGGGVQLGSLGTVATKRPIVPAPVDYDEGETSGMMIGRGNRSTRRKPAPVPLCSPQNPHAARTRTRASMVVSLNYCTAYKLWGSYQQSL
jgi:hypothetical protein